MNERSQLRIADLKQRRPSGSRMMNVKVPSHQAQAIARLATELLASKTEIVVALLNAGLEIASKKKLKR